MSLIESFLEFPARISKLEQQIASPIIEDHTKRLEDWRNTRRSHFLSVFSRPRIIGSTIRHINKTILQTLR